MMYSLLIALEPKSGTSWPWTADLTRPDDLLPLHYEGRFTLQLELLLKTFDLRLYGQLLGEALFQGDLRDALTNALAQARQQGWLRIQLSIDPGAQELRAPALGAAVSPHRRALGVPGPQPVHPLLPVPDKPLRPALPATGREPAEHAPGFSQPPKPGRI